MFERSCIVVVVAVSLASAVVALLGIIFNAVVVRPSVFIVAYVVYAFVGIN